MLANLLQNDNLIFYILAVEVFVLLLLQLRTNGLLKRTLKIRVQKKEQLKQLKEEVRGGKSDIPVVKFEKEKAKTANEPVRGKKKEEKKDGCDMTEMAVLQEMMTEFFG